MSYPHEVDFNIVGGGACGITLLTRLARSNPSNSFLVVERGQVIVNDPSVTAPAACLAHLMPGSKLHSQRFLNDQLDYVLLTLAYSPERHKVEDYQCPMEDASKHGNSGNLKVHKTSCCKAELRRRSQVTPTKIGPYTEEWLDVLAKSGVPHKVDIHDGNTSDGCSNLNQWKAANSARSEVATSLLYPLRPHFYPPINLLSSDPQSNVHILYSTVISRILIEGGKATGEKAKGKMAKPKKPVVLPPEPEVGKRKGRGPPEGKIKAKKPVLEKSVFLFYCAPPNDTHLLHLVDPDSMGIETSAKITMTLEDVKGTSPTFQQHWKKCFADYPDKAQAWIGFATNCLGDPTALGEGPFSPLVRDLSSIHISDSSPDSAPNFKAAFTSEEQIIDTLVWIYKKWRTVNRQLSFYRGEPAAAHPKFSNTSPAATQDYAEGPAENHTVVYLEEDEVALREFVVEKMASVLHLAGTCAMGSALDSDLNVVGVKNLKVADLSVMLLTLEEKKWQVLLQKYGGLLGYGEFSATVGVAAMITASFLLRIPICAKW
ncbi:GMC oxidoreductase [Atractiella rhizophila]|nr:GMC oxidoreductase [Atractiella rhizophila]